MPRGDTLRFVRITVAQGLCWRRGRPAATPHARLLTVTARGNGTTVLVALPLVRSSMA